MPSSRSVRPTRHKKKSIAPTVTMLVLIISISAAVAGVWQMRYPVTANTLAPYIDPALLMGPIPVDVEGDSAMPVIPPPAVPASVPKKTEGGSQTSSSEENNGSTSNSSQNPAEVADRAANTYFDDAAFVGDSITTGIQLYDVMANADVFADTGISPGAVGTRECVKSGDKKITIMQALKESMPTKIYIMLGGNALGGNNSAAVFADYERMVDSIVAQHPDSLIYIQSVLPLNEAKFKVRYNGRDLTNSIVNDFNLLLKEMCATKKLVYLDVASAFRDSEGAMPDKFTPDGIHLYSEQYVQWFDYLKKNTAAS